LALFSEQIKEFLGARKMTDNIQLRGRLEARPRVGLALGSGSARGLAHFGVIRALADAGIEIDYIAGTSVGALIGTALAAGKWEQMEATFRKMNRKQTFSLFDFVLPKSGLIDGARLRRLVHEHIHINDIEALPTLFHAVATDILSGEEVVIRSGDIIEAVRASSSVPGLLKPVRHSGRLLVDGALVNPVPVSVARDMGADIVIAVDVNHHIIAGGHLIPPAKRKSPENAARIFSSLARWTGKRETLTSKLRQRHTDHRMLDKNSLLPAIRETPDQELPSIFEVLLASVNIMGGAITQSQLRIAKPDLIIQPELGHFNFVEFDRADEIIAIGYECARKHIEAEMPGLIDSWMRRQEHEHYPVHLHDVNAQGAEPRCA
jgi:NTE family protein